MIVARNILPEDPQAQAEMLHEYFCELIVESTPVTSGWKLQLQRPPTAEYYVDPRLEDGLAWWSRSFYPIGVCDIPLAAYEEHNSVLALSDAWTITAWSKWLADYSPKAAETVTLLHADDHDDLMSPRLVRRDMTLYDAITNLPFNCSDPVSVAASIRSGAIGMGSFIVPLIHALPRIDLRHLCATEYGLTRRGRHTLLATWMVDTVLAPGLTRPAARIQSAPTGSDRESAHAYEATSNYDHWLQDIADGPILFHLDMDYFNNRFDGDSDRVNGTPKYDPPIEAVLEQIDTLFYNLEERHLGSRIVSWSIALSPAFFPAEFWEPSIRRVQHHLARLKVNTLGRGAH